MFGPYAAYVLTSYVLALLIGWVAVDYRSQTRRLRELDESGVTRRSGRRATELP